MISVDKSLRILNQESTKYTSDQARVVRDFLITLAEVEYQLLK